MNNALNLIGRLCSSHFSCLLACPNCPALRARWATSNRWVCHCLPWLLRLHWLLKSLGSIALLIGFQTRFVAAVLAIFTLVATLFFHAFWAVAPEQAFVQQLLFFKNIGVIGGLLVLASSGAGAWSLDAKKQAD